MIADLPIWAFILIIIAVIAVGKLLVSFLEKTIRVILMAPGKGFKKIVNGFKNYGENREQSKLDKALLKTDEKHRLDNARTNQTYATHPIVKRLTLRKELKQAKIDFKKQKKSK